MGVDAIPCGLSPVPAGGPPSSDDCSPGGPSSGVSAGAPGSPSAGYEGLKDEDTCSDASFMSGDEAMTPEEKLAAAISLKDAGNTLFKAGNYSEALEKYKEGEERLKSSSGSEAIAVSVQLSSNSCMCCLRLERWSEAIQAANKVLSKEPRNQKALYRRAVARSNLGRLQQAKEDLMEVLSIDSTNLDARKELQRIREKIQIAKAEDKKAYSGLFNRASGLYGDREAEREQKRKAEEEEKERRRKEWQIDMNQRKEKGEEEEDFETWLRKAKEAEDREREEKQKQQAKLDSPSGGLKRRSSKSSSSKSSSSSSSSSVMEVDEEDAAIINETKKMGYCYFRRNLTEEEKRLNAQNKPTKIETSEVSPQSDPNVNKETLDKNAEGKSISQWNSKGTTYEEKDVSPWARTRFAERLQEAAVSCGNPDPASPQELLAACAKASASLAKDGLKDEAMMQEVLSNSFCTTIETTRVEDVSGDAHLAVVRGSRRVFFDMKCSLHFKVACSPKAAAAFPEEANKVLKEGLGNYETTGVLKLPDVSSADGSGMSWLDGSSLSFDTPPSSLFKPLVDEAVKRFREAVVMKIQEFLEDCKALP